MSANDTFWPDHNGWWTTAAARMADGTASDEVWEEAGDRIRTLLSRVEGGRDLKADETDDLVQAVLLRLCQGEAVADAATDGGLLSRMTRANAPAHYLRKTIRNLLTNEGRRERRARTTRAAERYAEFVKPLQERDPANEAGRREVCRRVWFVVYHIIGREDREVLVLRYFDGLTTRQIARRLKITHGATVKRLFRAKNRMRFELSNPTT